MERFKDSMVFVRLASRSKRKNKNGGVTTNATGQTIIDTQSTCFFCFKQFSSGSQLQEVSLFNILRFLEVSAPSEFREWLPTTSIGAGTSSNVSAKLCPNCARGSKNLSQTIRMYEVIRLYLVHHLELVSEMLNGNFESARACDNRAKANNSKTATPAEGIKKLRSNIKKSCKQLQIDETIKRI